MNSDCVFCEISAGPVPGVTFVQWWHDAFAIVPLGPVTLGHTLVIPRMHVADFAENSAVTAMVVRRAADLARRSGEDFNLITSKGEAATQSVMHLHVHLVPRRADDGLMLPWSGTTPASRTAAS